MPKLLMISGDRNLAAGKQGAFYNTLEEFHQYWERIDIICPKTYKGSTFVNTKVEPLFGNVFIHPSPWPLWKQPWWIYKKGQEIYRKQKFNLVTVHEYPPFYNGIGARLLWKKTKAPYVLEIHHIPGYPKAAHWKEKFYCWLLKNFIKYDASKAKAVRTVNKQEVPEFLKKAGVPEEKIKYIPSLYIDLETFRSVEVKTFTSTLEKEYHLIFIGRLAENKGISLFLEAVKKSGLKAVIVGDGPLAASLKFKIKSLKLENNIVFHGWAKNTQEIAQLLNRSQVLIMPSYNEGGPRVVMEAMACGVPVLATPVGIVPDVILGAGEIIGWSAEDIAQKAQNLLTDREKYNQYSLAGVEMAKNFEKKAMIKNYADQLKKLI